MRISYHKAKGRKPVRVCQWKRFVVLASVLSLLSMPLLNRVEAAAGDIDSSFGVDGKVTTKFPGGFSQGNGLVIQNDGKIVAGGSNSGSGRSDFAIARYNTDGSLDSTFGSNGKLTTDFLGSSSALYALALQPDGKIIGAGSAGDITDFALVRY